MTKAEILASRCSLCEGSGEILKAAKRVMGYTLTPGENIDEHLVPCPLCKGEKEAKNDQR